MDVAINKEVHDICSISINQIASSNVTAETIAQETDRDEELAKIKTDLINGNSIEQEYTLDEGVLFKGQRVVVPKVLRPAILSELHNTHIGVSKMKQLARRYCTWNGID